MLYVPVNSYGHVGKVSSPNHIFFLGKLDQAFDPLWTGNPYMITLANSEDPNEHKAVFFREELSPNPNLSQQACLLLFIVSQCSINYIKGEHAETQFWSIFENTKCCGYREYKVKVTKIISTLHFVPIIQYIKFS